MQPPVTECLSAGLRETKSVALVKIASVGISVPERILTNADLEKMVGTNDEWIVQRTGIHQRHIVDPGVATSDLASEAALKAIAEAGIKPSDIELIIVATVTPDMPMPATACRVQHKIGAINAWSFDLSIGCSGFLYALQVGIQFIVNKVHKNVLIIGADLMSSITDYTDRASCIIFGDAAGAVVLQPSESEQDGCVIDFICEVDGASSDSIVLAAGGSRQPATHETVDKHLHYVRQDGKAVFKFATRKMAELCERLLEQNGLTCNDVDLFVPHQANLRIIEAALERVGIPIERAVINIGEYGNTAAASLLVALDTALRQGRLKRGDLVLLAAMGAGLSSGATLLRW